MTVGEYVSSLAIKKGRGLSVGLIGFGVTNRAVYSKIADRGYRITVRQKEPASLPDGCIGIFGNGYLDAIDEDVLLLSPTVHRDDPRLILALGRGTVITSECEVFFDGNDSSNKFAVTGSDGKSTVTSMAAEMLGARAVGNIGVPYSLCETANRWVAELSSFNLQYFSPKCERCVITNIKPNHLDWHSSAEEYFSAKAHIRDNARSAVLCADDAGCTGLIRGGEILYSSRLGKDELKALGASRAIYLRDGVIYCDGEGIILVDELSVKQEYNIRNFMAAVGLSAGYREPSVMREVGRSFKPLRHRCETVHISRSGVTFIDSSIDTTPERMKCTLDGLSRRVLLLLGGRGKGLSLEPMVDAVARWADAVAVYGEIGEEVGELFAKDARLSGIPFTVHNGFDDAFHTLSGYARGGDTLLLSPAATGYGEFLNYEKRGERFCELARRFCP